MYWEEKLDIIKKKYSTPIFKDMFREGRTVVEKIIRIFHNATYMTFTQCDNPETLMKNIVEPKQMSIPEFEDNFFDKLTDNANYWLFLIDIPMGKSFQVYDCQKEPLLDLYHMASSRFNHFRFYIVDKKYKWMYYIDMYRAENVIYIYESKNEE